MPRKAWVISHFHPLERSTVPPRTRASTRLDSTSRAGADSSSATASPSTRPATRVPMYIVMVRRKPRVVSRLCAGSTAFSIQSTEYTASRTPPTEADHRDQGGQRGQRPEGRTPDQEPEAREHVPGAGAGTPHGPGPVIHHAQSLSKVGRGAVPARRAVGQSEGSTATELRHESGHRDHPRRRARHPPVPAHPGPLEARRPHRRASTGSSTSRSATASTPTCGACSC